MTNRTAGILVRVARDERGGAVSEHALVIGLAILATLAAVTTVGAKVLARWHGHDGSP